ncbi:hypothetical protein ACP4OV_014379 [Aristida adscensionis]
MANRCKLPLAATTVVLALLVSPIACSRLLSGGNMKSQQKPPRGNHTAIPSSSAVYGSGTGPGPGPGGDWQSDAGATYYGAPEGDGGEGGACGYQTDVGKPPFDSMIAAGSTPLYRGGEGCGACYEVRCTSHQACSGEPVTIVITDESPGGLFPGEVAHFDMSGTAMGAMAKSGMADQLRAGGVLRVDYRRVPCKYSGQNIAFKVDQGANPFFFEVLPEFEDDDGDLSAVDLMEAGSGTWTPMAHNWGATWRLNNGRELKAPFTLRLTSDSGKVLVATNAIPAGWKAGVTYHSLVNYYP